VSARGRVARLALLAAGTALGLLAAEGLVRALLPQPLRPAWNDVVDGIRVPRPFLRGRHRHPGAFDVTVSINRQRLRARREYAATPAAGTTRIAVLGDSMAFGWGAEDDDTYPAQLERLLDQRGLRAEVINAGFPGTCLGEKAAWYVAGVRPLHPRLVLLTLLGDDVDGDLFWRPFRLRDGRAVRASTPPAAARAATAVPGTQKLAETSQAFALFRRAVTRALSRERTSALGQRPATAEEARAFREEGLPLLRAEIRWLDARVREDGASLAIVLVPFRQSVYGDAGWWADELRWKSRAIADAAGAEARALAIPFLDVTPAMSERARALPALYHAGSETHPTPLGYRTMAEVIGGWLWSDAAGALTASTAAAARR
jgi:lysophospholipase L1-like esterase